MAGFLDLIGTSLDYLRVGLTGFRLKNSAGIAQIRNTADSEHAALESSTIGLKETGAAHLLKLQPATMAGNVTLTFPAGTGSAGYVLGTDGTGVMDWVAPSSSGVLVDETDFTQASSSPLTMFTPPPNAVILKVVADIEAAAGGGSPTLAVGITGTTGKYMATTQNNLKEALVYETTPNFEEDGTPDPIIATIVASAQTFSGRIRTYYVLPS